MGLKMKTPSKKRALAPERKLPLQYAVDMAVSIELMRWADRLNTPSLHLRSREATLAVKAEMLLRAANLTSETQNEHTAYDRRLFVNVVPFPYHNQVLGPKPTFLDEADNKPKPPKAKKPLTKPVEAPVKLKPMTMALQRRLGKVLDALPKTSAAFSVWSDIKRLYPEAVLIGVTDNEYRDKNTCMFFPDVRELHGPSILDTPDILAVMESVGGGFTPAKSARNRTDEYKGWALCRVCGCRNGTDTHHYHDMLIPSGARHYTTEHDIPTNLFSLAVSNTIRLWYVAKSPYDNITNVILPKRLRK